MPRILYFDCFSGASGDMILGALLDAGLPLEELRRVLGSLALEGIEVSAERVSRAGVAATKLRVQGHRQQGHAQHLQHQHGQDREHPLHHEHPQHPRHLDVTHHSLAEIDALIERSALPPAGRARARALFQRLGETEAEIHQVPVERIHLHEVGALDSIVDIVGVVFGLAWFGDVTIMASPLNVGAGTVECAHGTFPVPAPATAALVRSVPIYSSGPRAELLTPTGALLLTAYAEAFGPIPPMRIDRIGYGAGERDFPGAPNVLRLLVGERADVEGRHESVVVMECEIDDMNPQLFGPLMDRLQEAGALDVFYAPVQMKKNRPGTLVTIVAPPDRRVALAEVVFRETTTIGIRYQEVARECLDRESIQVDSPLGPVRVKVARRNGRILNAAPEFEDCAALAARHGLPVKEVQAVALKAYLDTAAR
jgi:uncharacterized protein (TIGR00299 family) protein